MTVLCLGTVITLVAGIGTVSSVIVATGIVFMLLLGLGTLLMLTKIVDREDAREWRWRYRIEENESERRYLIEEHREERRRYTGQQPQQGSSASGTTATRRELPDLDLPPSYHECNEDPRSKR